MKEKNLINVEKVAEMAGVSRNTVHNDINKKLIKPAKHTDYETLFTLGEVERYKIKKGKKINRPLTISVVNHKGGVGKSTVSIHLAYFLAENGYKVLFLDNDPQGNSSNFLLYGEERTNRMPQVYIEEEIREYMINTTHHDNIDVISANTTLEERYQEINNKKYAEDCLKRAFEKSKDLLSDYQYIIIDNHPDLKQLTFNSMVVADGVLIVTEARAFAIDSVEAIQNNLSYAGSRLLGIVLNMYRTISNKAEEAKEFYEQKYGDNVLNTFLPYWDGLSLGDTESGEFIRKSVPYLNGDDKVKQKINELGKEILERIQNKL